MEKTQAFKRRKTLSPADIGVWMMILSMVAFADISALAVACQAVCILFILLEKMNEPAAITPYIFWMLLFAVYAALSCFWAGNLDTVFSCCVSIGQIVLIGFALSVYLNNEGKVDIAVKALIFGALVLCVRVLISAPIGTWGNERIGLAIGYNANKLGYTVGFAAIWCVRMWQTERKKRYLAACAPLVVLALLTGSRKAFFLLIAGFGLISFLFAQNRRKALKAILFSVLLLFVFYFAVMNIGFFRDVLGVRLKRLTDTLIGAGGDRSSADRLLLAGSGLKLFQGSPLFGYGLDNFRFLNTLGLYAHNNYVELACDLGAVGLVLYYSLPAAVLLKSIRRIVHGDKHFCMTAVFLLCMFLLDFGLVSYSGEIIHLNLVVVYSLYRLGLQTDEVRLKEREKHERLAIL